MALPKNFNSKKNLSNRIDSLNNLIYCTVKYDFTLTGQKIDEFDVENEVTGVKEIYALNQEQVEAKIENWFTVLKEKNIIENYKINSIENKSFYETLKDKNMI